MSDPITWSYFFDPSAGQVIRLQSDKTPDPSWMPIEEFYAQQLIAGQNRGEIVYLNQEGYPALWVSPEKPTLNWDEKGILTPPAFTNGVVTQRWIIDKLTVQEKLAKLAELRYYKQHSIVAPMRIVRTDAEGNPIDRMIITDPGTWFMMSSSVTSVLIDPDMVFKDWKFAPDDWESVKGSDLLATWKICGAKIEECFSIEARYSKAICAGMDVNINQWTLIDLPLGYPN